MEATSVRHEVKVLLQERCCMSPGQVEHHGEWYPVPERISCAGSDLELSE